MYLQLRSDTIAHPPDWLHYLETCTSTNVWAFDHATELYHGDVVFTQHQTAGKGQHGRVWHAPPGVFTASFVCGGACRTGGFYALNPQHLVGLSLAAGLAVIYAVEDLVPSQQGQLRLKWANDVWMQGAPASDGEGHCTYRKLAGVLCEAASNTTNTGATRVVIGVGLNRCVDFAATHLNRQQIGDPISLHEVSSNIPSDWVLLERLRHYLLQTVAILLGEGGIAIAGLPAFLPELRQRDGLRDRRITLQLPEGQITGIAAGIDSEGRLRVQQGDVIQSFSSARVINWE